MKKIVWEAWEDPYHSNTSNFGGNSVVNAKPTLENFIETQDQDSDVIFGIEPKPTIATPYGLLSITDDTLASNRFDFWILHTNFDITNEFVKDLEQISGVETIEVYTRYRLRIGFPKTPFFDTSETKSKINSFITSLNEKSLALILENIKQTYGTSIALQIQNIYGNIYMSPYWNIFIYPNGQVDIIIADKYEDFSTNLKTIKSLQQMVGGVNINSEDI